MRRLFALLLLAMVTWVGAQTSTVEVNAATVAELDSLRGVGPAMSRKILDERAKMPFVNWQDLSQRVTGLGSTKAARLSQEGLRVNGLPLADKPEPERQK